MKNFKLSILTALTIIVTGLVFVSCEKDENNINQTDSREEIARFNNDKFEFTNKVALKKKWEETIKLQGYQVSLEKDFILTVGDIENKGYESYILIAKSLDGTIKSAFELEKKGNSFYKVDGSGTVTCAGCRRGCDPKKNGSNWECTDCKISNSNCSKSVTVSTD